MKWYKPDFDMCEEYAASKFDGISDYIDNNLNILFEDVQGDSKSLGQSLKFGNAVLKQFERKILDSEILRTIYKIGQLRGAILAYSHSEYEKKRDEYVWNDASEAYSNIKHFDEVILYLGKKRSSNHTDLSRDLDMQESTMTECMKKILSTDYVTSSRVGRYKVYKLTDNGIRYFGLLKSNEKKIEDNKERVTEYLDRGDLESALNLQKMDLVYDVKIENNEFRDLALNGAFGTTNKNEQKVRFNFEPRFINDSEEVNTKCVRL